jgi:hypothetical protein
MRWGQGSDARPLTCAQPVMPGLSASRPRWRSDDRHLALEDVDEVGQLVDRGAAQQRADLGDPAVTIIDGKPRPHLLGARDHRAQLEHVERRAVLADAMLAVDRVALGLQADREDRQRDDR